VVTLYWRVCNEENVSGEIIRYVERGCVSHVEFITPDGETLGARLDGGVAIRPINYKVYNEVYKFSLEVTSDQWNLLWSFLRMQLGKPYDMIDIGAIGIDKARNWRSANAWVCSELWAAALEWANIVPRIPSAVNLITPEDTLLMSLTLGHQFV
jgi:hypothetical protein